MRTEKELKEMLEEAKNVELIDLKLREKAEKLEDIEALMREDRRITIIHNDQYTIQPWGSGDKLASAIMAILFPDEPSSEGTL